MPIERPQYGVTQCYRLAPIINLWLIPTRQSVTNGQQFQQLLVVGSYALRNEGR